MYLEASPLLDSLFSRVFKRGAGPYRVGGWEERDKLKRGGWGNAIEKLSIIIWVINLSELAQFGNLLWLMIE